MNKKFHKAISALYLTSLVFGLHGKIVFFDGTYVVGKVTKVDESMVFIIPIGLDTPEGVLIGNIDTLRMENGTVPVINSSVRYFFDNGQFLANNDDWMDQYNDFKYDENILIKEDYKYKKNEKGGSEYWQVTIFSGFPAIKFNSLADSAKLTKLNTNFGAGIQTPFFPFGAVDIAPSLRFMTYGFDNPSMGLVNALQFSGNLAADFKPVFFFLPKDMHVCVDIGFSYNLGLKVEPTSDQYEGEPTYSGTGLNMGISIDYYLPGLPIGLKLFGVNTIVPQSIPFPDEKTGFVSFGANLVVVLKRSN